MADALEEFRLLTEAATPAPWRWVISIQQRDIHLERNPKCGNEYVMDFVRWGMGGATPRFRTPACVMEQARFFAVPITGREHHSKWYQGMGHPDAVFIEKSREMVPLMFAEISSLRRQLAEAREDIEGMRTRERNSQISENEPFER